MPPADFSFIILDSIDSTNNYAMAKVHEGMTKQGDAYFTSTQISGKGQRGKGWQTGEGQNIALSIVLEMSQLSIREPFYLSAAVALACFDLFSKYGGDETTIKWPNDIYWRDRKAGGILIETVFRAKEWKWAIIGIGININQVSFAEELKNPVSLKQVTGKDFDLVDLAKELHALVMSRVKEPGRQAIDTLLQEYNLHLYKLNERVKLNRQQEIMEATIKGVNAKGQLIAFSEIENRFDFGEVVWEI